MESFFYSAPTKNAPLRIFISYRGDQAGVSLDFEHLWVGKICTKFGILFKICNMGVLIPLTIIKNA